jgi:hypothetical protein
VDPRLRGNQETPNLALDLVVAPFSDPSTHQPPTTIEEVFRRPRVVSERAPNREVVVESNRIRQAMVADAAVDVLRASAEIEFRGVYADNDQTERPVITIPRLT